MCLTPTFPVRTVLNSSIRRSVSLLIDVSPLQAFISLHYQALYHYYPLDVFQKCRLLLVPHTIYLQSPFPMNKYHYHLFPSISVVVGCAKRKTQVMSPIFQTYFSDSTKK